MIVDSTLAGLTYSVDGALADPVPPNGEFTIAGDGIRTVVVSAANSDVTATQTVRIDAGNQAPVLIVAPTETIDTGTSSPSASRASIPARPPASANSRNLTGLTGPYTSGVPLTAVEGDYLLTVTADDAVSTTGPSTDRVRAEAPFIEPVAPTIDSIVGPTVPAELGTAAEVSIEFSDGEGTLDDYTVSFDWGLNLLGEEVVDDCTATSAGTGSEAASSCSLVEPTLDAPGSATGTVVYPEPGVYTVTVEVRDSNDFVVEATYEFIVIFDPGGGRVAGSGIYWSDNASFMGNGPRWGTTGIFGYNARYRNGASTPTGKTSLTLLGGFRFKSTAYDYLIVNDTVAVAEGVGKLNGQDGYRMRVQGIDNGRYDFFQITIWDDATDEIIYDNGILYEDVPDDVRDDRGDRVLLGGIRVKG